MATGPIRQPSDRIGFDACGSTQKPLPALDSITAAAAAPAERADARNSAAVPRFSSPQTP